MIAALLSCFMLAAVPLSAFAQTDWQTPYSGVLNHISGSSPNFGSVNGEWRVFALARSGRVSPGSGYACSYYERIEDCVSGIGSGRLNSNRASDNSRLVIALTSIGRNARNVAGFDIVEPLTDQAFVKRQGPTGAAYALLALGSNSVYGETQTKDAYVDFLLGAELSGGGWSLSAAADPDVTAIVITALAQYSRASSAVGRGIAKLSSMQLEDGRFQTIGNVTSESSSQVVLALSTVGVDADTDERFIKNGNSALSALITYYSGSGFSHTPGGPVNEMASEQAAYALAAYHRFKNGRNDLFNMNDVSFWTEPGPTPEPTPAPTPTAAPTPTPSPSASASPVPTASAAPTPEVTGAPTFTPGPSETQPTPDPTPDEAFTPAPEQTEGQGEVVPISFTEEPSVSDTSEAADDTPSPTVPDDPASSDLDPARIRRGGIVAAVGALVLAGSVVGIVLLNRRKKDEK